MTPHPLTLAFALRASEQPVVNFPEHDLSLLEGQLHGFDEALSYTGQLGTYERFNRVFGRYVASKYDLPTSHSWALALMSGYGRSVQTVDRFRRVLGLFVQACAASSSQASAPVESAGRNQ